MPLTPDLSLLPALEDSLWRAETRYDLALMDATFAEDFLEFGRSGRRYTRDQLLPDGSDRPAFRASLHDLSIRLLSDDLAQVTYVSEFQSDGAPEWANRSSLWDRASGRWFLRFHQGTPLLEALRP